MRVGDWVFFLDRGVKMGIMGLNVGGAAGPRDSRTGEQLTGDKNGGRKGEVYECGHKGRSDEEKSNSENVVGGIIVFAGGDRCSTC